LWKLSPFFLSKTSRVIQSSSNLGGNRLERAR
jgi:hypothetical protein